MGTSKAYSKFFSITITALGMIVSAAALEIDNGLMGKPEVECGAHRVELQFRTQKQFTGKVFVKGHYNEEACKVTYGRNSAKGRPTGGIVVDHGSCGMDRRRQISPKGMQFSAVIVVSFHPTFITKIDRAFHVKCMYRELNHQVTAGLSVSPITTEILPSDSPMPTCTYTIRKDKIDGEVLKYARVGEQVVHRWECQSEIYGILVHSCYISDGQGDKVQVIDEKGCHVDRFLLGDPTYVDNLNLAYRESHVFKFADRIAVRFQCQIRLCMKDSDGCNGITPPMCDGNQRNVDTVEETVSIREPARSAPLLEDRQTESVETLEKIVPVPGIEGRRAEANGSSLEPGIKMRRTEMDGNNKTGISVARESPELSPRRTEISEDVGTRFFQRRRFYKREAPVPPPNTINIVPKLGFSPVDGDFVSQYIYVLESTETPTDEGARQQESLNQFLRRSNGLIVGEIGGNSVCLSNATFSILLSSVALVLISIAAGGAILFCQKRWWKSKSSSPPLKQAF